MAAMSRTAPQPPPGEASADATDVLDTSEAGPAAIRGSLLRTSGYVAGVLLALGSTPLVVRHLGVIDFGRYVTVLSLAAVTAGVTEAGVTTIALREYAVLSDRLRERMMRDLLGLRVSLSLAGVVLAVAFAQIAGYGSALVLGTVLAGTGFLLQALQGLFGVALQAQLRLGWVTVADLVRQAVLVAMLVLLVVGGAGIVPFLAAGIPAGVVALVLTAVLVRGTMPMRPSFAPGRWWSLLRDTLPFALATAIGIVYFRVTIVVMSLIATKVQTGYFATSYRILEVLVLIPGLLVSTLFPVMARAARDDLERLRYALGRTVEVALVGGAWMALCTALGAHFAIDVIAGHKFLPAVPVLRIQGLAIVATFVGMVCGLGLLALRRQRALVIVSGSGLVLSVLLNLVLVPLLQARGAAIATIVTEVLMAVAVLWALIREGVMSPPWLILMRVVVCAGLGALVVLVPVHDVVRVVLASALYFGVLQLLGGIPAEVQQALRRRPAT
jgi:O-antigen/teichoic acid export membrane protein